LIAREKYMDDALSVGANMCVRAHIHICHQRIIRPHASASCVRYDDCDTETSECSGYYGPGGVMPDGFVACALLCDPDSAIPVVFCAAFCFSIVQSNV